MNKSALWSISYGVYVVSSLDGDRHTGCIANSIMQVTSDPATVAISINHDNYTNSCIKKSKRIAISVLSVNTDPSIIGTFGFNSGKDINKFSSVGHSIVDSMAIIDGCCSYIICDIIDEMEASSHTVFLGKVVAADVLCKDEVMTYAYYHKVMKGVSPKNAPTYIKQEDIQENNTQENNTQENNTQENKSEKYVCSLCGYEYDGDIPFEMLPEDYTCPICGQPKSMFKKHVV